MHLIRGNLPCRLAGITLENVLHAFVLQMNRIYLSLVKVLLKLAESTCVFC